MAQDQYYGSKRQGFEAAKGYITQPGTTMGVGQFGPDTRQYQKYRDAFVGVGQQALNQGMDMARRQAGSMAAGAMGANAPLMQRQALIQGSDLGAQAAQQGALMSAQEQQALMKYLAQLEQMAAGNYATAMGGGPGGRPSWMQNIPLLGPIMQAAGTMGASALSGLGE